jgi:hypothetical protein
MTQSLRPTNLRATFFVVVGSLVAVLAAGADDTAAPRWLNDIKYLASDDLEGRGVGTKGIDLAADYISAEFRKAGLKPALANDTYFQPFTMPIGRQMDEKNTIVLRGPDDHVVELAQGKQFVPLRFSASSTIAGPLVFAGYGITAPEYAYDDYAGLDVKDKVVLLLRHEPGPHDKQDKDAPFQGNVDTSHARFDQKAANAAAHGAIGVLYVSAPHTTQGQPDALMLFGQVGSSGDAKLPLAQVTRSVADPIVKASLGKDLAELDAAIDSDLKPRSGELRGWTCSATIKLHDQSVQVKNVIGVLDGAGPHAEETIVLGAHYDHLGHGGMGSLAFGSRDIHNGADDNASGTAGLLELARRLAGRDKSLGRRVLFIAFTAEESGLIGAAHYIRAPAIPKDQTIAMLNMDMIGRLRNDKLIVYGTGTAPEFPPLLETFSKKYGLKISPVATGEGPSDQAIFYRASIPVLHFFTDNHPDYHKPSDDWEKISVEGTERVIDLIEELTVALADGERRPVFAKADAPAPSGGRRGMSASLGSIPAYSFDGKGVLLDGVTAGSPAEKAGLQAGDILVRMGDREIDSVQALFEALGSFKPGDNVKVTVIRGTLRVTYPVTLAGRARPE